MAERGWRAFERDVAEMFGLDQTVTSGNKWFDSGDAVSRDRNVAFPLWCDAKYSERASMTIRLRDLRDYQERAAEVGKRCVLPLRFFLRTQSTPDDYALLSLSDLVELMNLCAGAHVRSSPLLSTEECELLHQAAELMSTPARMALLQLVERLSAQQHTEVIG